MSAILREPGNPSLLVRLNESSRAYRDPLAQIPWDSLEHTRPWMPEHLLSLYGLPAFERLSAAEKIRLSQCEYIAFVELGLWLEGLFMQRIVVHAASHGRSSLADYEYQLHELREEVGHSLMFLELIKRSGMAPITSAGERPRLANLFARLAPYQSAAFWITILIGEEIPDRMNRVIRQDRTLPPAILAMTQLHMREEARHIAYARDILREKLPKLGKSRRLALSVLLRRVSRQFVDTCFFPKPALYAAAGLPEPVLLARLTRSNPERKTLIKQCIEPTLSFLRDHHIHLD